MTSCCPVFYLSDNDSYFITRIGKSSGVAVAERVLVTPFLGPGISGLYVRT